MKTLILIYIFTVLTALSGEPPAESAEAQKGSQGTTSVTAEKQPTEVEQLLALVNKEREKAGLKPVSLSKELIESAKWMAQDMADHDYFNHTDRLGRKYRDRATAFGYIGWSWVGENIALGQKLPDLTVKDWMNSPGHKANILRPEAIDFGAAMAISPKNARKIYWVITLGRR